MARSHQRFICSHRAQVRATSPEQRNPHASPSLLGPYFQLPRYPARPTILLPYTTSLAQPSLVLAAYLSDIDQNEVIIMSHDFDDALEKWRQDAKARGWTSESIDLWAKALDYAHECEKHPLKRCVRCGGHINQAHVKWRDHCDPCGRMKSLSLYDD